MASSSAPQTLRKLGLIDVFAIGVNAIVGSGVFSRPDDMHRAMGGFSPLAFLLCAALLTPVALCFAELAGKNDATGGPYLYASKAFGPHVGFIVGWSAWLNAFISWAANTTLFVALIGIESPVISKAIVAGTILALGALNFLGVKPGSMVIQAVVFGKITAIFCFIVLAIAAAHPGQLGGALPHGVSGIGSGIYIALFPFQGFEVVPVPAGETKNPKRNMPLGTIGSLLFAAVLYVVVQALLELSYPQLGEDSRTPLVDAARALNPTIGWVVFVGGIVSIAGFTAGSALGAPRYAQAMASAKHLPVQLASLHSRFRTPHVAIAVSTVLAALLGIFFDYDKLVGFSNVTVVLQYAFSCIAVIVLRQARHAEGTPSDSFRVPWGPILPIIGAVGSIALVVLPFFDDAPASLVELVWAGGGIVLGVPVFLISSWLGSRPGPDRRDTGAAPR